jgi:serine kinase of HPr protein (carbohydrate metabolism regulator)
MNIHGTAILIGDRGVLITGPSGSGKSSLALALIAHFSQSGLFSSLVGDDQLFVAGHAGRLVCRVPPAIAGLVEVPGLGPKSVLYEVAATVDLVIRLIPPGEMQRMQDEVSLSIEGCSLPALPLARRNIAAALPAIAARLKRFPFRPD